MIRIDHISFDLAAPDEDFARRLYSGWDGFCRHGLERVLEESLAPYGEDKAMRVVERLDLDLGKIPEDDFHEEFPRRLEEELRKALAPFLISMQGTYTRKTPALRMDNLLFRLEHGHSLPEWADNDTSLQDDMEWLTGQPSETYAQAVERAAGLCLRKENALRRLLWQAGNEKLQADIFSAAMTLPIALQDKRRFLVLALDARPDIVLGFVHGTRDDDSLRGVADLLESPSVAIIMRTETENHAEVDLPAYWHYLYEWLIRYYPYEGVAMFGGKAEFTRHLHFRLLTFIRKRRYSFYLSKAELTVDFLQEVFGQAYYIDVLNAIYGLQPHNADGSPVHDGYFNLELYRTFLRLSLLRLPTDAAHVDEPAGTRDENGQPDMTARRQGAIIGGETSIWRNAEDFIKWIKDTSVPESHRQAVVRMIAAEHPDEWIAILKILPAEGNDMDAVADSLPAHILLQGIGRKNFYQAAVLERAIGRIQTNAGKYPFLSRGGTALQASLSKALLLFMQDENTLGRTLTEAEILERFLKHLYSAHTGRTDSEGYAAWHQLAADMKDETGTGAPETADAASGIQTEELPRDPEELLEQIRRSVAQDKLTIGQWSERLGTAYLKWLAANYCLSASDLLRQVIEAMQVDESTERAVWAAALIKDKGKAWLYNTRRENVRSFVETICGLQGKDKAETEDAVKRITDVTAPMEDMDTPIDDTPQDVTTVDNAGLCLLALWFVRLFDMLGYLDGERKAFKDTASKVRAVFLLQYLACGKEEEWCEPDLTFNRLLTALPGYVPLPGRMELTDEERQTADSMVQGVKANWREMDGTSVEGFRQSFILRDGMLEEEEHHWTLTVADKPYDILLDTVPWGFRQIRLPWLKKYVQVAWHEKQEF